MGEIKREGSEKEQGENLGEINLKRADPSDINDILNISSRCSEKDFNFPLRNEEEAEKAIEEEFFYLIRNGDQPIGDISYRLENADLAHIESLRVVPEFRRQGIAREALKKVLDELKSVRRVDLLMNPKNEAAINLYHSLGFKRTRKITENYFDDDTMGIEMVLIKKLK